MFYKTDFYLHFLMYVICFFYIYKIQNSWLSFYYLCYHYFYVKCRLHKLNKYFSVILEISFFSLCIFVCMIVNIFLCLFVCLYFYLCVSFLIYQVLLSDGQFSLFSSGVRIRIRPSKFRVGSYLIFPVEIYLLLFSFDIKAI